VTGAICQGKPEQLSQIFLTGVEIKPTVCLIICNTITMQLDMFEDERMKILYALSFMCGG